MSQITDALNMAEAARQVGNLDLAVRILIQTMEEKMRNPNYIKLDRMACASKLACARSRLVLDHHLTIAQAESILRHVLEAVAELTAPLCLLEPAPDEIRAVAGMVGIETSIETEEEHE